MNTPLHRSPKPPPREDGFRKPPPPYIPGESFGFVEMDVVKAALMKATKNYQSRGDGEMSSRIFSSLNNVVTGKSVIEIYTVSTLAKMIEALISDSGVFSACLEINYVFVTTIADPHWINKIIDVLVSSHPLYTLNEGSANMSLIASNYGNRFVTVDEFRGYLNANSWMIPLFLLRTL